MSSMQYVCKVKEHPNSRYLPNRSEIWPQIGEPTSIPANTTVVIIAYHAVKILGFTSVLLPAMP